MPYSYTTLLQVHRSNNNSILFYSILTYFCANSTAQGPITKLARLDEIYKHTQSTKQGKIIITIRIIIIVVVIVIIIIIIMIIIIIVSVLCNYIYVFTY
jgi:hypothetical protein